MKKIIYFFASILLYCSACNPIEDREELGSILTADQLDFVVKQPSIGSNTIILESITKGILPFWSWGSGFSNKVKDTISIPFANTYFIKYTAYCAGGTVTDSTEVTVAKNDDNYFKNPAWQLIAGTDPALGKTWVFATDLTTFSSRIWGNGGWGGDFGPGWWGRTSADASQDNIDINSEMKFDLNRAKNTFVTENGITKSGFFELLLDTTQKIYIAGTPPVLWSYGTLKMSGITIPHGISQNENKKVVYDFAIVKLTADEMVLAHQTATATWEGWYWRFKRKGFVY